MYSDDEWEKVRESENRINHMLQLMLGVGDAVDWWYLDSWKFGGPPIRYNNIYELEKFVHEQYLEWRNTLGRRKT